MQVYTGGIANKQLPHMCINNEEIPLIYLLSIPVTKELQWINPIHKEYKLDDGIQQQLHGKKNSYMEIFDYNNNNKHFLSLVVIQLWLGGDPGAPLTWAYVRELNH